MILLIISILSFYASAGIYAKQQHDGEYYGYQSSTFLSLLPFFSSFVLAIIPETFLFDIRWYWLFLINIPVQFIGSMIIGALYNTIWYRANILSPIIVGIITMIIGIIIV